MTPEQPADPRSGDAREPEINKFFRAAVRTEAGDIHLKVGQSLKLRVHGQLKETTGEVITEEKMEEYVFEMLSPNQKEFFLKNNTVDFAHEIGDEGRFRVNIFRQRGVISLAARRVNTLIPPLDSLNLPPMLKKICDERQGLVLIVGPTGCGKTTTIASMIDYINTTRTCHILTIEDPIEYLFKDKRSIVSQREIGIDVQDFDEALKYLMRQDPDVVFVGEMRDVRTATAAMRASETGHLVFGTMYAAGATQAVQRLMDMFNQNDRNLARQTFSLTLRAIIGQMLLPSIKEGVKRIPAVEIVLTNPEVKKLIAEGHEVDLPNVIRNCQEEGMQDLTDSLCKLVKNGSIDPKDAYKCAPNVDELKMAIKGIRASTGGIL